MNQVIPKVANQFLEFWMRSTGEMSTVEKLTALGYDAKNGTRGIGEEINRNNNGYAVSEENFKTGIFDSKMALVTT